MSSGEKGDNIGEGYESREQQSSDLARYEASKGKEDLANSQKKYIADLKDGMPSGITDEFGKPLFFDSLSDDAGKKSEIKSLAPEDSSTSEKSVLDKVKSAFSSESILSQRSPKFGEIRPETPGLGSMAPLTASIEAGDLEAKKERVQTPEKESAETPELQKLKDGLPLSPEQEKQLRDDLVEINKLPEAQRKEVLESLDRIASADTKDSTKLDPKQRAELVASLAHQIAHPESIKQGQKDTCVAANVEKTLAMSHPDQYAQMAADLATRGEYTTPDGKTTVKAQRDADGKLAELSDPSGQRSASSELMQTAITNLGLPEGETYKSYKPGHLPVPEGLNAGDDSGERVHTADGKEKRFEGLSRDAKQEILKKLMPEDGYQERRVQSVEDLGQAWKDNGGKGPLHATVRINAEHTGMGQARDGSAGTHAVVITHMEFGPDGKPTKIFYENTADSTDHSYPDGTPVPADEFVKSMQQERSHTYKDGSADSWPEPMKVTVRTDGSDERQSKIDEAKNADLDKAVEEFRDSTHKDAFFFDYGTDRDQMRRSLEGRPRWEIEEINKRYKEKYGSSLDEEIVDELGGKERVAYRKLLKGSDTDYSPPPPPR